MENGKKDKQPRCRIEVRATPAEREKIKARAQAYGFEFSQFVRVSCLSSLIKPRLPVEIRKNLAGWSRNLNQLAHHANSTGTPAEIAAVEALRRDAQEIISLLSELT